MTVELAVPPSPEFFATIRAVARTASALADLNVIDIEELQIAVSEAATLLLPIATDGSSLEISVDVEPGHVRIDLAAVCKDGAEVDTSGLAWMMLTGLDPDVRVSRDGATTSIAIERRRATSDQ
ncbi:MAG: hypothetical protein ACTHOG_06615 [Marmoricola sp.]